MARLDRGAMFEPEAISRECSVSYFGSLKAYHDLAVTYHSIFSDSDRQRLVENTPILAAQVFYHFGDMSLGDMLAQAYRTHPSENMRFLAGLVRKVVGIRESLPRVLDTRSVALRFEPRENDFALADRFEDVERIVEGE